MKNSVKLFIGMPTYDGEVFIKEAIESLINQTFTDWVLLVSDNGPSDNVKSICAEYVNNDERIKYVKQPKNYGPMRNFNYLYDEYMSKFGSDYFMWAQADDLWEGTFIEKCILAIEEGGEVAFTGMDNIDTFGRTIRHYKSFTRFANNNKLKNQINFLLEPEMVGKCNMFMGVYKKVAIDTIMSKTRYEVLYSDYVIAFGIISHFRLKVVNEVLYHKRDDKDSDCIEVIDPTIILCIKNEVFTVLQHIVAHFLYLKHSSRWQSAVAIVVIFFYRLPRSFLFNAKIILRSLYRKFNREA